MDGNASKEMIARVSLALFARKGFESVGVNEIAEKTGLAKPSLYYHFGSKDGLLEAIIKDYGQKLFSLTEKAAEYQHDLVLNLTKLFGETVSFAMDNEDFFRLLLRLFSSAPETPGFEAGFILRSRLIAVYTGLFRAASCDHGNMKNREKIYAETFWGLVASCATLVLNGTFKFDSASQFRIVHQYMHGIFS
jgi:TetR/AcrR family transcriptional regulator